MRRHSAAGYFLDEALRNDELSKTDSGFKINRDGPGTGELRHALNSELRSAMKYAEDVVIQSPTSSGKTYTSSTTQWQSCPEITGGQPVIFLSGTIEARDDAIRKSRDSSVSCEVLKGRKEACSLAGGKYDSDNDEGNVPVSAPDGGEPSEWFNTMCGTRGLPLSVSHGIFEHAHDDKLPCSEQGECPTSGQWNVIPRDGDGNYDYDVLHATHQFARVPQLRNNCNLIIDEQPDFSLDISTDRIRRIVRSYLNEIEAPIRAWEPLLVSKTSPIDADLGDIYEALEMPDSEWFKRGDNAHLLAPGITEAIVTAEERSNDRWVGTTWYTCPDLNPRHDSPGQEVLIRIVIDGDDSTDGKNDVRLLQTIPDFGQARCVIGLDAYPTMPKWRGNTLPTIEKTQIIGGEELHKWRRNQRNLQIIQVGDNKNSWTNAANATPSEDKVAAACDELRHEYGDDFQSGITTMDFEEKFIEVMKQVGIEEPLTTYHGRTKSINTFRDHSIGLIAGCISPSDEDIKDWMALMGQIATPEREVNEGNPEGQTWVGPDADVAHELIEDVRAKNVLQACGRYARSPKDPDDWADVYALTNVLPDEYVDEKREDVQVFGRKQKEILSYLTEVDGKAPAYEITEETSAGKRHVHKTIREFRDLGLIETEEVEGSANVHLAGRCAKGYLEV